MKKLSKSVRKNVYFRKGIERDAELVEYLNQHDEGVWSDVIREVMYDGLKYRRMVASGQISDDTVVKGQPTAVPSPAVAPAVHISPEIIAQITQQVLGVIQQQPLPQHQVQSQPPVAQEYVQTELLKEEVESVKEEEQEKEVVALNPQDLPIDDEDEEDGSEQQIIEESKPKSPKFKGDFGALTGFKQR